MTLVLPAAPRWLTWGWLARRSATRIDPPAHWLERDELGPVATPAGDSRGPGLVELYHQRRLALVRLAVLLVDDQHTAEDVVQDAFTAVYRRHGAVLTGVDNVGGYLQTAVVNAARSVLRRRRTARAAPPRIEYSQPTDERLLLAEEHQQVLDALALLPQRQREVLVLRYWSDLSEAQIADALRISRGTVKSTASRALAALEKQLQLADPEAAR